MKVEQPHTNLLSSSIVPKHIRDLPCASICGFKLKPSITKSLIKLGDTVSLYDLYLHLNKTHQNTSLTEILRTSYEYDITKNAYLKFYEATIEALRSTNRAKSNKLAWILPDNYLLSGSRIRSENAGIIENQIEKYLPTNSHQFFSMYCDWLPWMSLGIATHLRHWRLPRISSMRHSIFKLTRTIDGKAEKYYPWEPGFDLLTGTIPMQALYQFEPSNLTGTTIRTLSSLGLVSVNDLRFLHPDAVVAAKSRNQPLFVLYRLLKSSD